MLGDNPTSSQRSAMHCRWLRRIERAHDRIGSEANGLHDHLSDKDDEEEEGPFSSLERLYDNMDATEESFA